MADRDTDRLYNTLRSNGGGEARGNGYQLDRFFRAEQATVLSALTDLTPVVDIGCGSGLLIQPAAREGADVYGLEYNLDACHTAHSNGLSIIRGDAFKLPFADASIGQIVNCQFLNQQDNADTRRFLAECGRVLKPGGRLILTWRHARSWLHRSASVWLRLRKDPAAAFPQFVHPAAQVSREITTHGMIVRCLEVTWPFNADTRLAHNSLLAGLIGASYFMVAEKRG